MLKVPYNETYKRQAKKLLPATFKKGLISSINVNSFSADVMFIGNQQTIVKNIPFASSVNINAVKIGDRCRVDLFDETNPNDMCIAYTYGRTFLKTANAGIITVPTGGIAIAHGLGQIPNIVGWSKEGNPNITLSVIGGTGGGSYLGNVDVYQYAVADATNIYLKSVNSSMVVNWFAFSV